MSLNRRLFISYLGAQSIGLAMNSALAADKVSGVSAYIYSFNGLHGGKIALSSLAGKPFMVVNTASQCMFTPQYGGLQALWKKFGPRGLTIIGVPSNDFGGQEPGGGAEISKTASGEYGVTFPMAAKVDVVGANAHPFYKWALAQKNSEAPRWNFHKYLVGADGYLAATFASQIDPQSPAIVSTIERQLAKQA